jgi:hypothetical protein
MVLEKSLFVLFILNEDMDIINIPVCLFIPEVIA